MRDYWKSAIAGVALSSLIFTWLLAWSLTPPAFESMVRPLGSSDDFVRPPGAIEKVGGMEFIWVPAGDYFQGGLSGNGSSPMRKVNINPGFWLGKFEVTQEQWKRIMGTDPSTYKGSTRPVEGISWPDAKEFCKEFSRRHNAVFRLPTEAEWEYACKRSTSAELIEHDDHPELLAYNWVAENSTNTTHPVGQKKSNLLGFHDMGGNVYEWCLDTYRAYDDNIENNPVVLPEKVVSDKVCRGGGYDCALSLTLPDYRMYHGVNARIPRVGMRVLMEAGQS